MKRKFTANSRIINDLFARYITTFHAFCELINNSIQAEAENINIDISYYSDDVVTDKIVEKIVIKDDGNGVYKDNLMKKILNVGGLNKKGGKGIGRFAALQLGKSVSIESIGYDEKKLKFSYVNVPLPTEIFNPDKNVNDIEIDTVEKDLSGKQTTYYKVIIDDLYNSLETKSKPKRKITEKFLSRNFRDAIFERYPIQIFNKDVNIYVNDIYINPDDYIIGEPEEFDKIYQDTKGIEHEVRITAIKINTNSDKRKVFITTSNAGIVNIVSGFEFDAKWLSPKIGDWFLYVHSATIDTDMYRNIDLDSFDENIKKLKNFIKYELTEFFKRKNKEFDNFTDKLQKDKYYPYSDRSKHSPSKTMVFDKLAYLVEDQYQLLNENIRVREIIYPLIDKTISNGQIEDILREVLKLNKDMIGRFHNLLKKSDLENIIEFNEKIASKLEDIDFLEQIVYSKISKSVQERTELHKFLEQMLWVFGERYNDSTRLLSDKNLENNLEELRNRILVCKPKKKDENIYEPHNKGKIKSITDLFMYSEKIIDEDSREVLIVELKAPRVKISPKELEQVMKYAQEIEEKGVFPDRLKYKIILVSSDINKSARFRIKGNQKGVSNPYFYFKNESENIEVWVVKWSDLFENLKRKLKYTHHDLVWDKCTDVPPTVR